MDDSPVTASSPTINQDTASATAGPFRRIVVALFGAIGDVILSTPLLEALRSAFPQSRITYLVGSTAAPVLANLPLLDDLLIVPDYKGAARWNDVQLFADIAKRRFDLALCLSRSEKLALAFWLARVPVRVGYLPMKFPRMFTHLIDGDELGEVHRTEYFLAAAVKLGIPKSKPVRLHYHVTPVERDTARAMLKGAGADPERESLIAIHPGTSTVQIDKRRWAIENFVAVASHIVRRGRRVILLGGPDELGAADAFRDSLPGQFVDMTGRLGLRELAAVLEQCNALVHNDSSPLHLAGAVGTPVLAIFGYQNQKLWGPLGRHDRVVRRDLACSPCLPEFLCPYSFECIRKLKAATVIEALDAMLDELECQRVRA